MTPNPRTKIKFTEEEAGELYDLYCSCYKKFPSDMLEYLRIQSTGLANEIIIPVIGYCIDKANLEKSDKEIYAKNIIGMSFINTSFCFGIGVEVGKKNFEQEYAPAFMMVFAEKLHTFMQEHMIVAIIRNYIDEDIGKTMLGDPYEDMLSVDRKVTMMGLWNSERIKYKSHKCRHILTMELSRILVNNLQLMRYSGQA